MKKLFINLALIAFVTTSLCAGAAKAESVKSAVAKYKAKNYVGCLQDLDAVIKKDPSDATAYYYQALAFAKLGKKGDAERCYNKVIELNTNEVLVGNATKGKACLMNVTDSLCKGPEIPNVSTETELDKFIKSDKFYSNEVQKEVNKKKLDKKKQEINVDLKSEATEPSDAEIAQAVKTLAKVGFNPLGLNNNNNPEAYAQLMNQSNELAQLNMLMGNNNGGSNNNLLPLLLMNQNGQQKISPELIQTMMMSSMNADFGFGQAY